MANLEKKVKTILKNGNFEFISARDVAVETGYCPLNDRPYLSKKDVYLPPIIKSKLKVSYDKSSNYYTIIVNNYDDDYGCESVFEMIIKEVTKND